MKFIGLLVVSFSALYSANNFCPLSSALDLTNKFSGCSLSPTPSLDMTDSMSLSTIKEEWKNITPLSINSGSLDSYYSGTNLSRSSSVYSPITPSQSTAFRTVFAFTPLEHFETKKRKIVLVETVTDNLNELPLTKTFSPIFDLEISDIKTPKKMKRFSTVILRDISGKELSPISELN